MEVREAAAGDLSLKDQCERFTQVIEVNWGLLTQCSKPDTHTEVFAVIEKKAFTAGCQARETVSLCLSL